MFTYLAIKDRKEWLDKEDYEDIALSMLLIIGTLFLDLLLLLLQPILIIAYILITKEKE